MAVILEIIDVVVCRKIHGCGCVADNPSPQKSTMQQIEVEVEGKDEESNGSSCRGTSSKLFAGDDGVEDGGVGRAASLSPATTV